MQRPQSKIEKFQICLDIGIESAESLEKACRVDAAKRGKTGHLANFRLRILAKLFLKIEFLVDEESRRKRLRISGCADSRGDGVGKGKLGADIRRPIQKFSCDTGVGMT